MISPWWYIPLSLLVYVALVFGCGYLAFRVAGSDRIRHLKKLDKRMSGDRWE